MQAPQRPRLIEVAGIRRPNWVEFRLGDHGASPHRGSHKGVVTERLTVSLSKKIR
jgi:hypothetical protein